MIDTKLRINDPDRKAVRPRTAGVNRFRRSERLLKRREFQAVYQGADRRMENRYFLVLLKANAQPGIRLGVTVTKKIGHAVIRNRIKRYVREFFRQHKQRLPSGYDMVVIARRRAVDLDGRRTWETLDRLLQRPPG